MARKSRIPMAGALLISWAISAAAQTGGTGGAGGGSPPGAVHGR